MAATPRPPYPLFAGEEKGESTETNLEAYSGKSGRLAKAVFSAFDQPSEIVR